MGTDSVSSNVDYTEDAVSMLLGEDLPSLPVDFVLSLIDMAKNEGYDFSAYGRDYGAGNLLYRICEDAMEIPDLRIIKCLIKNGLNPNSEITRFRSWDGIVFTSNDLAMTELPSGENSFPKTAIELVKHHLAEGQGNENAWQNILDLLES